MTVTIIKVRMYKGIDKCDRSRIGDETLNMAKFTKLKAKSFYNK